MLNSLLDELVQTIMRLQAVRAIGLSGGERPLPSAGEGDLDLFLYCSAVPRPVERRAVLSRLGEEVSQIHVEALREGHWGQGDRLEMAGVETWLLYFTVAEAQAELQDLLAGKYPGRLDSYYYPIGRCAMWKSMRVLYDPDGLLASFKKQLQRYPEPLAQALLRHHVQALQDVEDLERAVRRQDVLFFHFALDLALDHFLQALFALNREYFPSRKRSEEFIERFQIKPADCASRLRQVVAWGGSSDTLEQAYRAWKRLANELVGAIHSTSCQASR